ncbi:Bug family tripartite tricarboxylate transporter substrate binding protein [Shumkonia mesophila]|uniref:Bug family tripartite tricarboxylate transporter substrate binding protein n=1 Tax=Shumkonia mesophila TaxID=2838854 RepID=UPI0029349F71|nr:tripartite tricarboxylate transporter substrate-binding protein [Shumkonia mesophila]
MNVRRRHLSQLTGTLCAAGLLVASTSGVLAADTPAYPVKTVTLITHSSPGGGSDLFLRQMIKYLGPQMGVTFVVKNVRGGGGAKALAELAKLPPDGSAFYATTDTCIQTPMFGKVEYTIHDLEPVVNVFEDPEVIYTRKDSPLKSLKDVMAAAKKDPKNAKWGGGTATELGRQVLERLKEIVGVDLPIVSFEGGGDAMMAVLNGSMDIAVGEPGEVSAQLEAGKIRLLAAFTEQRLATYPDVPTAKEQGVDLVLTKFRGLTGPKGLPTDVVKAWEEAIPKLLANPEYKKAYDEDSLIPAFKDQKAFQAYLAKTEVDLKTYLTKMGVIK